MAGVTGDPLDYEGEVADAARHAAGVILSALFARAGVCMNDRDIDIPDSARVRGGEDGVYFVEARILVKVPGTEYGERKTPP